MRLSQQLYFNLIFFIFKIQTWPHLTQKGRNSTHFVLCVWLQIEDDEDDEDEDEDEDEDMDDDVDETESTAAAENTSRSDTLEKPDIDEADVILLDWWTCHHSKTHTPT